MGATKLSIELSDQILDTAYFGDGLPAEADRHLRLAGQNYHYDEIAVMHLNKAMQAAPDHPVVLIGFYRFYFYKNQLDKALEIAQQCLVKATRDNGMDPDWRKAKPDDANFNSFEAILPRFFLFTLKGYAYLQLRLGNLEEGRTAINKLLELDPNDKLGGKVLLTVLEQREHGEEDGD
jgi:hypothetical protein